MIKKFDEYFSINENVMGIDFAKIKAEAYKFAQTKECIYVLSELDPSITDDIVFELKYKLVKYKNNIDLFLKKIISNASSSNEGIASTIILSIFGMHALLKGLGALKNGWSLGKYLAKIFADGNYSNDLKMARDIIISITFLMLMLVYLIGNFAQTECSYFSNITNRHVQITYKWNGFHDYKYYDSFNKEYDIKRVSYGFFEIYHKNKLIGYEDDGSILNLKKKKIGRQIAENESKTISTFGRIDLEKELLNNKLNPKIKKEIDNRLKERENRLKEIDRINHDVDRIDHEVDSLGGSIYENLDQAKKVIREAGLNYDEYKNNESFISLRNTLQADNKMGYLGLFTKFLVSDKKTLKQILSLYNRIANVYTDVIDKLRDATTGELKNVVDFDSFEYLDDALYRLGEWKIANQFIRQLPPTQKNLIWENGWFKPDLKEQSTYLISAFVKIVRDDNLNRLFFRKVASIKDKTSLIDAVARTINEEPWNYNYWHEKLSSLKNVIITWESKEDNKIICAVFTHTAIKKIAYMTSWCIVRSSNYFNDYFSQGNQFVMYDFTRDSRSDSSIIGFTLGLDGSRIACHDKADRSIRIPNLYEVGKYETVSKKYITIKTRSLIEKVDMGLLKILRRKLKMLLRSGPLSAITDWYND